MRDLDNELRSILIRLSENTIGSRVAYIQIKRLNKIIEDNVRDELDGVVNSIYYADRCAKPEQFSKWVDEIIDILPINLSTDES